MVDETYNEGFESSNINTLWLKNIYENIKNLEQMERMARTGFMSLEEFIQMSPDQRNLMIPELQYQNLKKMIHEMGLLITDLVPVVDKEFKDAMKDILSRYTDMIKNRDRFVIDSINERDGTIMYSQLTETFEKCLEGMIEMRRTVIENIGHLLFVKPSDAMGKVKGGDIVL